MKATRTGQQPQIPQLPQPTPATLEDVAQLLQKQVAPITKDINDAKATIQSTMQGVKDELNIRINQLDERINKLADNPQATQPVGGSTLNPLQIKIDKIETELASLQVAKGGGGNNSNSNSNNNSKSNKIRAVIGGLGTLGDLSSAEHGVHETLWKAWLTKPYTSFCKENFKGIIWAEFRDDRGREDAIAHIKQMGLTLGDTKVWSNIERTVEDRAPQGALVQGHRDVYFVGNTENGFMD